MSPRSDRKSTRLNSSHTEIYTLSLHDALPISDGVDEVLRAQQQRELAEVHLGDEDLVVAPEDVAEVGRERVEVAQVHLRDVVPGTADPAHAGADRAVRRAPPEDEHLRAAGGVVDLQRRERPRG